MPRVNRASKGETRCQMNQMPSSKGILKKAESKTTISTIYLCLSLCKCDVTTGLGNRASPQSEFTQFNNTWKSMGDNNNNNSDDDHVKNTNYEKKKQTI